MIYVQSMGSVILCAQASCHITACSHHSAVLWLTHRLAAGCYLLRSLLPRRRQPPHSLWMSTSEALTIAGTARHRASPATHWSTRHTASERRAAFAKPPLHPTMCLVRASSSRIHFAVPPASSSRLTQSWTFDFRLLPKTKRLDMDHGPTVRIVRHPTLTNNMPSASPPPLSPHFPVPVIGLPAIMQHVLTGCGMSAHVIRLLGRHPEHNERQEGAVCRNETCIALCRPTT
ncbi:hypothetical protein L226DRAFT_270997 [Lentinus tigrinus ALCF2SS1-7]|uniref:Uncharacterized protein n=1 Tax=Lentinus tigrinus ALCF2SS1-6 TaxID=1328759 RepID=A0A5C2S8T8_9APHY|nr:hypothetical protein L227DRAFT_95628 [Lentinus tigrinus ALCF2SS1-6]RPD69512.1 hypothetical protein L226DRAFT_270997 [Lentinus tigrinus ALCF2SS1-7]